MTEQGELKEKEKKQKKDTLSEIIKILIIILLVFLLHNFILSFSQVDLGNLQEMVAQPAKTLLRFMEHIERLNYLWSYFLMGLGVILVIEVIIRTTVPQYHRPVKGKLIGGIVLIYLSAGNIFGINEIWPLILIGGGIFIVIKYARRIKKLPKNRIS